ncbi:MAG: shikimate dehydrogenase [Rhodobacterales bacterium]|nr:MAG: shikimate dehydrogenase [Rhodobacterales bacterium]
MTDRYAVFGNPIVHSMSPELHRAFAAQFGEDMSYEAVEVAAGGFEEAVRAFMEHGGKGLNVTVPFKVEAEALADESHDSAAICGAANCLKFDGGRIIAENFDGIGLVRDITRNRGVALKGKRVLIAGAGGAARGALEPLIEAGVAEIVIANRSLDRAQEVAELLGPRGSISASGYEVLEPGFDVLINGTSASLAGTAPPIPGAAFVGAELAYDLAYGKGLTPFLAQAKAYRVGQIADGVGMLVEQAAEAFHWWRGKWPDTAPVIARLAVPLER